MYRKVTALALLTMGAAGAAFGQTPGLEPVLERLRNQGWSIHQVGRDDGDIKIEARKGGSERELTYDARTGALVKDEVGPIAKGLASTGAGTPAVAAEIAAAGLGPVQGALRSQGYSVTEVKREGGLIKIEATRGSLTRELTYDASSGALVKDEVGDDNRSARSDDNDDDDRGPGSGRSADDDDDDDDSDDRGGSGGRSGSGSDDDSDDDDDRGGRSGSDDDDDDRGGSGRGSDDDDDDDRGGASDDNRGGGSSGDDRSGGRDGGSSDDDDDDGDDD